MVDRKREPAPDESDPAWQRFKRKWDEKIARGGGPDFAAAEASAKRLEALWAAEEPFGFKDEAEIDDFIDASGLRKNRVEDWQLVPWSYWEARGAGPYRR
jgi:hypothetical protein